MKKENNLTVIMVGIAFIIIGIFCMIYVDDIKEFIGMAVCVVTGICLILLGLYTWNSEL